MVQIDVETVDSLWGTRYTVNPTHFLGAARGNVGCIDPPHGTIASPYSLGCYRCYWTKNGGAHRQRVEACTTRRTTNRPRPPRSASTFPQIGTEHVAGRRTLLGWGAAPQRQTLRMQSHPLQNRRFCPVTLGAIWLLCADPCILSCHSLWLTGEQDRTALRTGSWGVQRVRLLDTAGDAVNV